MFLLFGAADVGKRHVTCVSTGAAAARSPVCGEVQRRSGPRPGKARPHPRPRPQLVCCPRRSLGRPRPQGPWGLLQWDAGRPAARQPRDPPLLPPRSHSRDGGVSAESVPLCLICRPGGSGLGVGGGVGELMRVTETSVLAGNWLPVLRRSPGDLRRREGGRCSDVFGASTRYVK